MQTNTRTKLRTRRQQQVMVPLHIKITEEMHDLLTEVAKKHGFPRIQGLIRLYIRQGLETENIGYSLADDNRFLEKLKRQGVSDEILQLALHESHFDEDEINENPTTTEKPE